MTPNNFPEQRFFVHLVSFHSPKVEFLRPLPPWPLSLPKSWASLNSMMQAPSLQPHYRAFNTTTNLSAPTLRYVPRAGSYVPQSGLASALAAYTPDAVQPVGRLSSAPCSGVRSRTTLSTSPNISTLHRSVHFRSTSQATRDSSFSAFS